ncbi:hypothetical protein GPJ56_004291 [Histomonas meleagridis]|uniref:uncharacterized protein n=1 Tax=Histomonas meleagridis TaxID=135588 RepID=UPI003559FB6F|nr:hypothetical protein GPJ56_004291 [Histomonas meleagridis]KAH0800494.1 hypothetical protein GO595_006697 [Histomonas meleagridis]
MENKEENFDISNAFIGVAIASFDMRSGIKILEQWNLQHVDDFTENLNFSFRMVLGNVHRQGEEWLLNFLQQNIVIHQLDWFISNSTFIIKRPKDVYYAIQIILKQNEEFQSVPVTNILHSFLQYLTIAAKNLINKNDSLSKLKPLIDKKVDEFKIILKSGFTNLPNFNIIPVENVFFSTCLTSHLQTHMNTIIETTSIQECENLLNFLSHFTLPYQKRFSSLSLSPTPTPGLFLQCVQRQTIPIEDILIEFPTPCTWIRFPERQIIQTPSLDAHRNIHLEYLNVTSMNDFDDPEVKKRSSKLKQQLKLSNVNGYVHWANNVVSLVIKNDRAKHFICDQYLSSLIKTALMVTAMADSYIRKQCTLPVQLDCVASIMRMMKVSFKDDALLIVNVAQIYDPEIQKKLGLSKKVSLQLKLV